MPSGAAGGIADYTNSGNPCGHLPFLDMAGVQRAYNEDKQHCIKDTIQNTGLNVQDVLFKSSSDNCAPTDNTVPFLELKAPSEEKTSLLHTANASQQNQEKYEEETTPLLEEALLKVKTQYEAIAAQQGSVTLTIHAAFRKLREALHDRETELIGQLDGIAQGKLECLAAQRAHSSPTNWEEG